MNGIPEHKVDSLIELIARCSVAQVEAARSKVTEYLEACQRQGVEPDPSEEIFKDALALEVAGIGSHTPSRELADWKSEHCCGEMRRHWQYEAGDDFWLEESRKIVRRKRYVKGRAYRSS